MPKDDTADLAVPGTEDEEFDLEELVDQEATADRETEEVPAEDGDAAIEEDSDETETPAEETEEVADEKPVREGRKDPRLERILREHARLKRYEPIVDMIEEEPELGRQLAARRLGFRTEPEQPAPQSQQPQVSDEELKEQWRQAFERDPVGAFNRLVEIKVQQMTAGTKVASTRALVAQYKARRIQEEPLFKHYEPLFDALAEHANPDLLTQHPDQVLDGVESMAFGRWAKDQRGKIAKARSKQPAPAKEPKRSLDEGKQPVASKPVKQPRKLTDEEKKLADMYGDEYFGDDDEPEGNPWR